MQHREKTLVRYERGNGAGSRAGRVDGTVGILTDNGAAGEGNSARSRKGAVRLEREIERPGGILKKNNHLIVARIDGVHLTKVDLPAGDDGDIV